MSGNAANKIKLAKMISRLVSVVFVNLALLFLMLEISAFAWHYFEHGNNFYKNRPEIQLFVETERGRLSSKQKLHPYFGYLVNVPGTKRNGLVSNNHGFLAQGRDYPWLKTDPRQFIVGVFGGSVAQQLYTKGRKRLVRELNKQLAFKDKEIVILSFAQPGYKQPQQLLLLSYFLSIGQKIDLAINLDGFNEVVLSEKNRSHGIENSMPSSGHMIAMMDVLSQSELTPEKIELLAAISIVKKRLNSLAKKRNKTILASLGFAYRFLYLRKNSQYQKLILAYAALDVDLAESSVFHLSKLNQVAADQGISYSRSAQTWAKSSILMNSLARNEGMQYLHVLQPNQYHSNHKFGQAEANIALDNSHIYSEPAALGYPYLVDNFDRLNEAKIPFYSALKIYDQDSEPVYADACCHLNQLGVERLAEFIADSINREAIKATGQ